MGGDTLVLDCTDSFGNSEGKPTFVYAHLLDSTAPVGARVKKGQVIGFSGNSGTATTGPHCHVEALPPAWDWNNGTYGRVNPELFFDEYPDEMTIQTAGSAVVPTPKKEAKDVSSYKAIQVAQPEGGRLLGKDTAWFLKDRAGKVNQNFAVAGIGNYDIDLFIQGTGLADGETLEVQFFTVIKGKRSGYYTQQIDGTNSGKFHESIRFKRPVVAGTVIDVSIKSSNATTKLDLFGADIYNFS
jgi:hypothetical protein